MQDRFSSRIVALERAVRLLNSRSGPTPSPTRPDPAAVGSGGFWFDKATGRPSWSDGATWRYADGTPV